MKLLLTAQNFPSLWYTQGLVIIMPIVPTALKLNSPGFYVCPCHMLVWWRSNQKWSCYHPENISPLYNVCLTETKWQVNLVWIVRSDPKSNSFKILWLSYLPAGLMNIQSKIKSLSSGNIFLGLWGPQGQVTLMSIIATGLKLSLSEILCLPLLSLSLINILPKMKSLSSEQYFPHGHFITMGNKGRVTLMQTVQAAPK